MATPIIAAVYWRSYGPANFPLLISYNATDPEKNINWVFAPRDKPQHVIPPQLYLALEMTALPLLLLFPTHLILLRLFG